MKKFYTTLFTFFFIAVSFAQNTAVKNGQWASSTTWSKNQVPQDGDVVEVPQNITVTVDGPTDLTNDDLDVKVYGTLKLASGKLRIGNNSKITLYPNGTLVSEKNNGGDQISIGGIEKYNGGQGTLKGALVATKSSNGFVAIDYTVLPVKFASFSAAAKNGNVLVQWATAEEIGASYFEVERSHNGTTWTAIAKVAAAGNSSSQKNYTYTDNNAGNNTVYYRIKQADVDGKQAYTAVQTVRLQAAAQVNIIGYQGKVTVQFTQAVKGKYSVLVVNSAGQVVARQTIDNPAGQITLSNTASLKGTYFVSIQGEAGISASKQVVL